MENDPAFQTVEDDNVQPILLAASEHDVSALRPLLRGTTSSPANVRDSDTGYAPLHSAIHACAADVTGETPNSEELVSTSSEGNGIVGNGAPVEREVALDTVHYLLRNGAIWNQLDNQNETPGCAALRLGLLKIYAILVDAGVRAEMLLNRLDEYEPLNDEDSEDDDGGDQDTSNSPQTDSTVVQAGTDTLGDLSIEDATTASRSLEENADSSNAENLKSTLTFAPDRLLDSDRNGVMMEWEREIMAKSADSLVPTQGLDILNIGHGMGIIDELFQAKKPAKHHIIEAHSDVLDTMHKTGWNEKPGVTIHSGRWQDIVPKLVEDGQMFDAIYFDTFGEDYKALRKFFNEFVIGLLKDEGRFSFFNGLGADRQICYDVYAIVVEMDLLECGFDVDWTTIRVDEPLAEEKWAGLQRPYWTLSKYKLPIVTSLR